MEKFYTVKEAASILKLTERSIRNFINRGELTAHKLGVAVRINAQDLKEFIEKGRV